MSGYWLKYKNDWDVVRFKNKQRLCVCIVFCLETRLFRMFASTGEEHEDDKSRHTHMISGLWGVWWLGKNMRVSKAGTQTDIISELHIFQALRSVLLVWGEWISPLLFFPPSCCQHSWPWFTTANVLSVQVEVLWKALPKPKQGTLKEQKAADAEEGVLRENIEPTKVLYDLWAFIRSFRV